MGLAVEMAFHIRKIVVISIRTCYRSVRNYPFLFGLLCFLILLYRSCPFLFSLLVSASPVLICTAVLLGTLLSFGQPNIPEIETEEKVSHDVASLRSGILDNATVVAKEDDSFTVESFAGNKVGNSYVEMGSEEDRKTSKLDEHGGFVDFVPLILKRDREIQFEKGEVEEFEKGEVEKVAEGELHSSQLEERKETFGRDLDVKNLATDGENAVENQLLVGQSTRNEILEVEDRNIPIEPVHKEDDHLNLAPNDNDENDYDSSGSESDRAESSSPDASMADIIPLLDELHPLLDLEAPQPAHRSNEESESSSEHSHKSDGECVMSDDDAENQGEEGGAVENDDDDDDDDDEGMQEEKEDESKSAIKWTEDDQKNLMDLGSLELERNQRLENLIARRRARNNLRMLAGKNLIDLDGFDLPVNVPPISTARRNPFDLPYDSYDNMGLPPIPGSAPSILLPRRNPFDLPYDPNEEKPDLKGDDFEQEFLPSQQKDIFFRRHESFSVGPSSFAVPKQEQQNLRWRPYFMPEKIASEETTFSPLERQLSEVSESKLSSVSDTESMSSIADQDDKKPDESQSFLETTAVSYLDHTASGIEQGNGSWEDIGSEDYVQENRDVHHEVIEITLGSTESHFESQSGSSEIGAADTPVELNASEIHPKSVVVETDYSSNSSLSSLSEVNEGPFEVETDEVKPSSPPIEKSGIDTGKSVPAATEEDADFKIASEVLDDNQHKEPVYDSSPSAEGKESEVHSEIGQDVTSSFKDMHDTSSELYTVDRNELESREVSEVIKHEVTKVESPKHDTDFDAQNLSVAPELIVEHVSIESGPSFSDIASIEKGIVDNLKEDKDHLTSREGDIIDGIHKIEDENAGSSPSSDQISSRSLTFTEPEDLLLSSVVNHVSADIGSPSDAKHVEMHGILNNEENPEFEQTKIYRSSSSDSSSVEEVILQNDVICHTDQPDTSVSNRGSEIPAQDLHDMAGMTDSVATSHEHLTTANATIPGSQEQKDPPVVEEQGVLISSSSTFPSELEKVEECSMNEKEVVKSEQDFVQSSSIIKSQSESEALEDLDIKIASGSSNPDVTPEVITSVTELDQSWSDKPMVEPVLSNRDDGEEPGILSADSAAEVNPETITPQVHQDISTALSSVDSDSSSSSSDHDFRSPNAGGNHKDDIIDEVVFDDREEVSKHLDYLAEAYGSHFSEKMIREEVDEIADIDEGLLSELDEVGDFSVKEVGEPVLEKNVMPNEAQAESSELGSNSNSTETKSDLPILEARTLDDINLAFRQLHEGVDVEEVILPSAVESQVKEEAKPEINSDLEVVEARSLGDIHVALMQVSVNNIGESGSSSNPAETKSDITILEARSLDDIHLAFRQLHEGVDVEDIIVPSAIENQVKEETKPEASSDLEVVEARSLGDIHVALMQVSVKNLGELPTSSTSNDQSEEVEQAGVDSITEIAPSNMTDANKPADIIDEKSVEPNVSASKTKDKKAKSEKSESGASSSSSSSDSD